VGVVGGKTLIEQVVSKGRVGFSEGLGEGLGLGCLGAGCAVGMEGMADYEGFNFVLADETGD
jgi:hypothetical protein